MQCRMQGKCHRHKLRNNHPRETTNQVSQVHNNRPMDDATDRDTRYTTTICRRRRWNFGLRVSCARNFNTRRTRTVPPPVTILTTNCHGTQRSQEPPAGQLPRHDKSLTQAPPTKHRYSERTHASNKKQCALHKIHNTSSKRCQIGPTRYESYTGGMLGTGQKPLLLRSSSRRQKWGYLHRPTW